MTRHTHAKRVLSIVVVLGLGTFGLLGASACGSPSGPIPDDPNDTDYISDVASAGSSRSGGGSTDGGAAGAADGGPAAPPDDGGADRAIAEADIIQTDGDRLFALSQYSGLTIIDISNPSDLRVLGNHRANATPFEMYLKSGVAYIMYNSYWTRVRDDATGSWTWQTTARMQAVDVSNPASMHVIGDHEVQGDISDSRMVGDVIYLVTHENGWCWRCAGTPETRVASFDASDPRAFVPVDELTFDDGDTGWGRSIAVTTDRLYVGGPRWTWDTTASDIQVVDISDPAGALRLGASVRVDGNIESRWQIDERDGVLRVISQNGGWASTDPPVVQTFDIVSSNEITPLGRLALELPPDEDLRSVRFDGDRAYAITLEERIAVDPLFTIDLTDPANPVQRASLEIPGWIYHMEPRGDRLYALGYDDADAGRGMTVSIFDVADLSAPVMLDRAVFGGTWAWAVEDQDRIHKAFNLMLDRGLILVPFAGSTIDETSCSYDWASGIQIIDTDGDSLALRGTAPQIGTARRSLLRGNTLFGVSDNAVQTFDITDRDAPRALDRLEVARNVSTVRADGEHVMRFGSDWWTERAIIDFAPADDASTPEPIGEVDLSALYAAETDRCNAYSYWGGSIYVHGDVAYVPRYSYHYDRSDYTTSLTFWVVDLSDHTAPRVLGSFDVAPTSGYGERYGEILLTDSALLVGRVEGGDYYGRWLEGTRDTTRYYYDVYDLTARPEAPTRTTRFEVPSSYSAWGWGWGPMGCGVDFGWGFWWPGYGQTNALVSGDIVASNHAVPLDDGTGRVRFYLDRLDVSDPRAPRMLDSVNIPGQVAHFDAARGYLVTVEDVFLREDRLSDWGACYAAGARTYFDYEAGTCRVYDRYLNALTLDGRIARRLDHIDLDADGYSRQVFVTDERVFVAKDDVVRRTEMGYDYYTSENPRIATWEIAGDGHLDALDTVSLGDVDDYFWWPQLVARGRRLFVSQANVLTVLDTTDPASPTLTNHDLPGWYCSSLEVSGAHAYCAMGMNGVHTIDL
jgi:uncharacterized secreted protein with C-terminal beta-propeller domain